MKKIYLTVAVALTLAGSLTLNSCIGSFALTKNVMTWNKQISNKFVNELVFFAFWVLPVYEVTATIDVLVLNSIEFWGGKNPVLASHQTITTEHGRYLVACDGKGYTITEEATGQQTRLDFCEETQTWSINYEGKDIPFMTFVDAKHVKLITPSGEMREFPADEQGVMAYRAVAEQSLMMAYCD